MSAVAAVKPPEWWPPADGEPIGEERARELVAYIRQRAPMAIDLGTAHLQELRPGEPVTVSAVPASRLATQEMHPHMRGICIGVAYVGLGGMSDQVSFRLTRAGTIAVRLTKPNAPVQRWLEV